MMSNNFYSKKKERLMKGAAGSGAASEDLGIAMTTMMTLLLRFPNAKVIARGA
jgi:hypothetical protein